MQKELPEFDKYKYYLESVQSPEQDAEFFEQAYWDIRRKHPTVLREDFCAAFALCCEWARRKSTNKAIGVDLDAEPLKYGSENYLTALNDEQKSRVQIIEADVLSPELPKADIVAALNFSYFGFKKRAQLLEYFKSAHNALDQDGIFILDCFGGPACHEPNEHETEHDHFSYFWDQDTYNPVTHEANFYIHIKRDGERKREQVFSYDWRMWGIAEIRDVLDDAGFSKTYVYWEGTDEDGEGNGEFSLTEEGEECESWVAYIVGAK